MLFNSEHFAYFFFAVLLVFFRLPALGQRLFLIAASYYFYMAWRPEYIVVIVGLTLVDYWAALLIAKANEPKRKRVALGLSILANLSLLFVFKYFNFFFDSVAWLTGKTISHEVPAFFQILPIGLSFHTFQSMAYTIDVYYGKIKPERSLTKYALFVSFFPQMVAGPIERASEMLPQFNGKKSFDYRAAVNGLNLIALGLVKKMVIADNLAPRVDTVYSNYRDFGSFDLLIATYCFAIQIYCDFSGYTDIARGCAKIMGFDLTENFKSPYLAKTIFDFWRRWHVSLSSWFRDYLYVPLGGSRRTNLRTYANIITVFAVSGLWHGASWTFVAWGMLHGAYLVAYRFTSRAREILWNLFGLGETSRLREVLATLFTIHCVVIGWIFFRANTLSSALYIARSFFVPISAAPDAQKHFPLPGIGIGLSLALLLFLLELWEWNPEKLESKPAWVRWPTYYLASALILFFGKMGQEAFIYFQF